MPTDEERREVAATLRELCSSEHDAILSDVVESVTGSWRTDTKGFALALADLIDQTCRNESASSDYFACSECGAELMQITPGWVALVNVRVNYCPNCGARIVKGEDDADR